MQIIDIVSGVNAKLAGETLTFNELKLFLDETIDDINAELNAAFPAISEFQEYEDYDCIPDMYIRSVVIPGAAYKFYVTDEEGISTATQYQYDYAERMFRMKRDYSTQIPEEYQADNRGYLEGPELHNPLTYGWGGW